MFKDIKAFLSSFIKKAKERKLFKKYLGITLAAILTVLIPIIIAVCYIQFKVPSDSPESVATQISVVIFDNDGHTIHSESAPSDDIQQSHLVSTVSAIISTKTIAQKPEGFERTPTFNVTLSLNEASSTYKCYFKTDASESFIEDNAGNFFSLREADYLAFLDSQFSELVYSQSAPPSLTLGEKDTVIPDSVDWSYKNLNGTTLKSTNYEISEAPQAFIIDGALDFVFSTPPTECNVKIANKSKDVIFDGTLAQLSEFTANEGDEFSVFINAVWREDEEKSDSFGEQSYHFDITCSEPSVIEITSESILSGTLISISISDVSNSDSIIYTVKNKDKLLADITESNPNGFSESQIKALTQLYEYSPIFATSESNAYALLPIPIGIPKTTFEFSISYGISKVDFIISLDERPTAATIPFSPEALQDVFTEAQGKDFTDLISAERLGASDIILFTSEFLSPQEYGFAKSIEYNSEIFISEGESFKFLAVSYVAPPNEDVGVKSANVGRVIDSGYTDLLGNYVVVDHGIGLYSWYCGLSSINVSVGDVLKKGELLGRSGSSSAFCKNGVNVFFTANGFLVSPSDIFGSSLI